MASQVTEYGCGWFLAVALGYASVPSGFFVALCSGEPGTGVDGDILVDFEPPAAAGYTRMTIDTGAVAWSDPSEDAYSTTLVPISFGIPTDDWGEIAYYALCTNGVGGQVYCYGEFDVPAVITATHEAVIPAGALRLQVASADTTIVAG